MEKKDWLQSLLKKLIKQKTINTRAGKARVFIGWNKKFNLTNFPATTSKKLNISQVAKELYCFLNQITLKSELNKHGVVIWDENIKSANMDGIGRIYGVQWRNWGNNIDQLQNAINELKTNKESRRAIVSAWNPAELHLGCLPPCHILFQLNIVNNTLFLSVYQRSADAFLGLPFDVASYAILAKLIQNELKIKKAVLDYHVSNMHLYEDHIDAANECISLKSHKYPKIILADNINTFHYNNVKLENYTYTKFIKAKMNL